MRFFRALLVLKSAFRRRSLPVRLHVLVRFLTCPFLRVVEQVPAGATVLEIGAGHGVFSRLAAERASRVIAVEPDLRKVAPLERVSFVAGFDHAVRGSHDVIAVIDVLYKLPLAEWDSLLERLFDRLAPGGILLIKEQDPTERLKNRWNRLQESVATSFGLTLGDAFSYEPPHSFEERLRRHQFHDVISRRIDAWYPHPHILYVARKR